MEQKILILGLGEKWRGDDGVGRVVAQGLQRFSSSTVEILELRGEATEILDAWRDAEKVIVIDCVQSGEPAGFIHEIKIADQPLPSCFSSSSTHLLGLGEAIELGKIFNNIPAELIFYGIEGRDFSYGCHLCAEVKDGAEKVMEKIREKYLLD